MTNYYLEGQPISSLIGQVGTQITLEVIATFLPRVVVDSLFSALRRVGLEIHSLTLEPIAAMTVAIPPRMRLLNLALVDIGAGTSDIALVREGSILGYAMVPMGGDEVTEKIVEHYLLDFDTAESLKCQLAGNQVVVVEDVLDNQLEIPVSEVEDKVRETLHYLATGIAREILTLNRKAPDAVLCVGGGSLISGLLPELARALELPINRVGMRTRESVVEIKGDFSALQGPQGVTPAGIAFNALQGEPLPFIRVVVNQREFPLWSLKETTAATALLAAGINMSNLYGKPGMGLTLRSRSGTGGQRGWHPPIIQLNGVDASLDTVVTDGDVITFTRGTDGQNARCTLQDIIAEVSGEVWVNGEKIVLAPRTLVNGQEMELNTELPDRARIYYELAQRLDYILLQAGVADHLVRAKILNYRLNDESRILHWHPAEVLVDGIAAGIEEMVPWGSSVEYRIGSHLPRVREVLPVGDLYQMVQVRVNGQEIEIRHRKAYIRMNNQPISLDDFLVDGADLRLAEVDEGPILSDVLGHIELNVSTGGKLVLKVDGREAGYTTPIRQGSEIEIYWK